MATFPYLDKNILQSAYSYLFEALSFSEEGASLLDDLSHRSLRYVQVSAASAAKGENQYYFEEYSELKEAYSKIKKFLASYERDSNSLSIFSEDRSFVEGLAEIVVREAMRRR